MSKIPIAVTELFNQQLPQKSLVYTESYQGDDQPTAREADKPYRYFYFQFRPKNELGLVTEGTFRSLLVMDEDQLTNDMDIQEVEVTLLSSGIDYSSLNIEASTLSGNRLKMRHDKGSNMGEQGVFINFRGDFDGISGSFFVQEDGDSFLISAAGGKEQDTSVTQETTDAVSYWFITGLNWATDMIQRGLDSAQQGFVAL